MLSIRVVDRRSCASCTFTLVAPFPLVHPTTIICCYRRRALIIRPFPFQDHRLDDNHNVRKKPPFVRPICFAIFLRYEHRRYVLKYALHVQHSYVFDLLGKKTGVRFIVSQDNSLRLFSCL